MQLQVWGDVAASNGVLTPMPYARASAELSSMARDMATFSPWAQFPIVRQAGSQNRHFARVWRRERARTQGNLVSFTLHACGLVSEVLGKLSGRALTASPTPSNQEKPQTLSQAVKKSRDWFKKSRDFFFFKSILALFCLALVWELSVTPA